MAEALQLARLGLYSTHPNPRVGALIVGDDGAVVGRGAHLRAGEPHAEVIALQQAGERARGATAVVTLEPCAHFGRTPPCCEALIDAGIARLVVAGEDPNPLTAGKGIACLQAAGIEVISGVLEAEAEALNPGFMMRMRAGRPFVRCKMAMSLDGRTAMASGESSWITGSAARQDVQYLRARSAAVVTGIGTVLHDNPSLNVRLTAQALGVATLRQPLRVILDPHLSTPLDAKILTFAGATLIVTACESRGVRQQLERQGAEVVVLPDYREQIDLAALMALLAEREINEVHLESGATLSGAFLRAGFIDELILYMAPKLLGSTARALFNTPGLDTMADAIDLQICDIRAVGSDWRITATVQYG
ncbi:MAG: bifunctional diaminohydroxyphosphoribosylaminopyrimidine deaminase/5-amino-6-(5-phosphoribosylamino)uracil reductase RibD [Gammaproteobacteria bacterium]|nr:bifunctional diaminohydroxyphosphoribosylaminopyrimidine deaminase/5-amino-6-(5-phosphoribosylamino)uracil reductase RibD [Gammaproteobacteria bacterium]